MGRQPSGKGRGRPKLSDEQKAANKAAREAAQADPAKTAAKKNADKVFAPKAEKPRPSAGAPKSATRDEPKTMHVGDMTPDQHFAKLLEHSRKLSAVEAKVVEATTARKGARDLARAELGKSALHEIKFFEQLQEEEGQEKWRAQVEWQIRVARWAEMPVGHIEDLFGEDRTPVEDKAKADGKRAGLAGESGTPPDRFNSGVLQQAWMSAYHEGQAVLSKGFKPLTANKAKEEPAAAPEAKDEAEPEETEPAGPTTLTALDEKGQEEVVVTAPEAEVLPEGSALYLMKGAKAFRAGHSRTAPASTPFDHTDDWFTGWDNAKTANDRAAAKAAA